MVTKFLEPGGDINFNTVNTLNGGWWGTKNGSPAVATDFVHGRHIKSIKYRAGFLDSLDVSNLLIADSGTRISCYIYLNALPTATATILQGADSSGGIVVWRIRLTSAGVIQLFNATAQIGTNGATLSTGQWYRISLAYTVTSTIVNRFELFKNGASSISITNATLTNTGGTLMTIGNIDTDTTLDLRSSDHYIDNLNSLVDTGDIWVTAKRPNANGTANNFSTQIGAGGSGYGTGHSPQVNERPLSTTNGWSMIGAGSAVTEEYNIEDKTTGDIWLDIAYSLKDDGSFLLQETGEKLILDSSADFPASIVDYMGWVDAKSTLAETGQIIVNNVTTAIGLSNQEFRLTQAAGSTVYPAGTGTDIGIITDTTVTTVSLFECGIVVAYIPGVATSSTIFNGSGFFQLLGVGT